MPRARLTLHQDKDENDFSAPIVSVSLGLPAIFLFGGDSRKDKQRRGTPPNGGLLVWGGPPPPRHTRALPPQEGRPHPLGAPHPEITLLPAAQPHAPRSSGLQ